MPDSEPETTDETTHDEVRVIVDRLARRSASGGRVIERAAIMAEGEHAAAILAWLTTHDWQPEAPVATASRGGGGLHGPREHRSAAPHAPARYVLAARPG